MKKSLVWSLESGVRPPALSPMPPLATITDTFWDLMDRGGVVMWPLLGLSLVTVTLVFERCWFWVKTNRPTQLLRVRRIGELLRKGDTDGVRALVGRDRSVYARVVAMMLDEADDAPGEWPTTEAVESQRPRLERFMTTLSTIITAAPLLGILGTVTGIIASFRVLAEQATPTDPRSVSQGIAEALLTTAAGLTIALIALFPYNAFRGQIDRTLGRIEVLAAAVGKPGRRTRSRADDSTDPPSGPSKAPSSTESR